jgi:hypothetical protein
MLGGAALIVNGLVRPSTLNTLLALGGAMLINRGVTGHCPVYRALDIDTSAPALHGPAATYGRGKRGTPQPLVDETLDHSFPASDPPSWTATSAAGSPTVTH